MKILQVCFADSRISFHFVNIWIWNYITFSDITQIGKNMNRTSAVWLCCDPQVRAGLRAVKSVQGNKETIIMYNSFGLNFQKMLRTDLF